MKKLRFAVTKLVTRKWISPDLTSFRFAIFVTLFSLAALSISGCLENKDTPNPVEFAIPFSPDEIVLNCKSGDLCPDNQGILFSVTRRSEDDGYGRIDKLSVGRCTGTVYALHNGLSAGHCLHDMAGADEIYFKTAASPGRPSRLFHVKVTHPYVVTPDDTWSDDYGAFDLVEAANGITYAHPAAVSPPAPLELLALVVNPETPGEKRRFVLDAVSCMHRLNWYSPFEFATNPSVFSFQDCKIYNGNSGGVMIQRQDPLSVMAVVQASNNAKDTNSDLSNVRFLRLDSSRGPKVDEGIASNARCFSLPNWPKLAANCLPVNKTVAEKATRDFQKKQAASGLIDKLKEWLRSERSRLQSGPYTLVASAVPVLFRRHTFFSSGKSGQGIAIFPFPLCVAGEDPIDKNKTGQKSKLSYGSGKNQDFGFGLKLGGALDDGDGDGVIRFLQRLQTYALTFEDGLTSYQENYLLYGITVSVKARRDGDERFRASYNVDSGPELAFNGTEVEYPDRLNQMRVNDANEIPRCKGGELEAAVEDLDKYKLNPDMLIQRKGQEGN